MSQPSELSSESLVRAIVSVFILGLMSITGLIAVMKALLNANDGMINAVVLLTFLLMVALESVFIWLLIRQRNAVREQLDSLLKGDETKALDAESRRALAEHVPSVTEHTTRAFDPVYSERKTK